MPATASCRCPRVSLHLRVLLLLPLAFPLADAIAEPNPIQRVINMLQSMQNKVEIEDKKQEALFDKFICYCQDSLAKLRADIAAGNDAVPQLEGAIKEGVATIGALRNDINDAKTEFSEAQKNLDEAFSLRKKENGDFTKEDDRTKSDIKRLDSAIKAMNKLGDGGAFLQKRVVISIKKLTATSQYLSSSDRDVIATFLAEGENDQDGDSDGFSESSPSEITGILKQMHDDMVKDNQQASTDEENAQKQFDSLRSAKESQMASLETEMSTKSQRLSQVNLQLVEDRQKLEETQKALETNLKLQASLSKECKDRQKQYDEELRTRSEELEAISDTLKILNDQVADQLFKVTMPAGAAASFLQLQASPKELRGEALEILRQTMPANKVDPRIDFLALALKSKKASFTKVLEMIDGMIVLLNKEQKDDADKKQYCQAEIDKTDDEKKELEQAISDLKKGLQQARQKASVLASEIASKSDGIVALDQQVAEATAQRKAEHQDYMENMQANNAAKEILVVAKARLEEFYNKQREKSQKLLQTEKGTAKKQVVGQALRIKAFNPSKSTEGSAASLREVTKASISALFDTSDDSDEDSDTDALVFMQVNTHAASGDRREESKGAINLISSIVADIEKKVKDMNTAEKEAQFEFEYAVKESAEKRAQEAKALSELEGFKAESEAVILQLDGTVKAKTKQNAAKTNYLEDLHKECDFILKHFETRRNARTGEIDALRKAKAVLSGTDAGFLQVAMRTWRRVSMSRKSL